MAALFVGGVHYHDRPRTHAKAALDEVNSPSNRLMGLFPPLVVRELQSHSRRRQVRSGETLHDAGDRVTEVCFPVNAVFALQAVLRDGHSIDVAMAGREGAVGMAVGISCETAVSRAVCQIAGEADFIPAERFISIVSRNAAACSLIARYGDVVLLAEPATGLLLQPSRYQNPVCKLVAGLPGIRLARMSCNSRKIWRRRRWPFVARASRRRPLLCKRQRLSATGGDASKSSTSARCGPLLASATPPCGASPLNSQADRAVLAPSILPERRS